MSTGLTDQLSKGAVNSCIMSEVALLSIKEHKKLVWKKYRYFHFRQQFREQNALVCLQMIFAYWCRHVPVGQLMANAPQHRSYTMLDMLNTGRALGLSGKGFKGNIGHLKKQEDPVILHLIKENEESCFVVCYGYDERKCSFYIADPSMRQSHYLDEKKLEEVWVSNFFLHFRPTSGLSAQTVALKASKKLLFSLCKSMRNFAVWAGLLSIFTTFFLAGSIFQLATFMFEPTKVITLFVSLSGLVLYFGLLYALKYLCLHQSFYLSTIIQRKLNYDHFLDQGAGISYKFICEYSQDFCLIMGRAIHTLALALGTSIFIGCLSPLMGCVSFVLKATVLLYGVAKAPALASVGSVAEWIEPTLKMISNRDELGTGFDNQFLQFGRWCFRLNTFWLRHRTVFAGALSLLFLSFCALGQVAYLQGWIEQSALLPALALYLFSLLWWLPAMDPKRLGKFFAGIDRLALSAHIVACRKGAKQKEETSSML